MASVAIIGSGPAGLTAVKAALECGLKPKVFEKGAAIGGLWKPTTGFTWKSMHTNLSRYSCMFSDFPWKAHAPLFPNQSDVYDYLQGYSQHFKLNPYIQLNAEVLKIEKKEARWEVKWNCLNAEESAHFDHVIVATGVFSKGSIPKIENIDSFTGSISHSQHYKTPEIYQDKKVAVIGNASSGAEIAAEIATVAQNVFHITRKLPWFIPKFIRGGPSNELRPLDFVFFNRGSQELEKDIPEEKKNKKANAWFKELTQQETYDPILAKEISSESPYLAISETYLDRMKEGRIQIKQSEIQSFTDHALVLKDQSRIEIDAAIFCTGYQTNLAFLDESILQKVEFEPENRLQPLILHQCTLHPEIPNMAFVGVYNAPFLPTMELQARFACQVFSGITAMPSKDAMLKGLNQERQLRLKQPQPQSRGDYIKLTEQLAQEIGAVPNFTQLQQEDPTLYNQLWNGPFLPSHFRLLGFGSQPQIARHIIDTACCFSSNLLIN